MNREEILTKAQSEGRGADLPDREAKRNGAWAAYIAGVILLIIVDTVNGLVLHSVNRGADFALFAVAFIFFLSKYLRLRNRRDLAAAAVWGILAFAMLAVWILQLTGVI